MGWAVGKGTPEELGMAMRVKEVPRLLFELNTSVDVHELEGHCPPPQPTGLSVAAACFKLCCRNGYPGSCSFCSLCAFAWVRLETKGRAENACSNSDFDMHGGLGAEAVSTGDYVPATLEGQYMPEGG